MIQLTVNLKAQESEGVGPVQLEVLADLVVRFYTCDSSYGYDVGLLQICMEARDFCEVFDDCYQISQALLCPLDDYCGVVSKGFTIKL